MGLSTTAIFIRSRVDVLMRTDHSVLYVDKSEPEIVLKAETIWIDGKPHGPPSMVEETSKDLTREHELERATKGNLRNLIEETPVPPSIDRRLEMATAVAESISHLHSRGVIWGDISTRNVLVFSDDTLKICDFASSALSQTYPEFGPHTYEPAYCPALPEERVGELSMMQRELYALGSAIYEITEWKIPYAGIDGDTWEIVDAGLAPVIAGENITGEIINRCWKFGTFESFKEIHAFQDITKAPLYLAKINICKLVEVDSKRVVADPPEPELQSFAIFTVVEEL
ncbi:TKL kinase [Fusarium napiforme]|uniref:TKL kinase n=1 Tax=Fusarium napiforme TaxID=42672 RepID=A0A8H5JS32_9HYPO|nr:TKL kinase [Fusarium napiforme]